jgi:hypothetical protein
LQSSKIVKIIGGKYLLKSKQNMSEGIDEQRAKVRREN